MKAEAETNAEADKAAKEKADKINEADAMIFQTEKQMKEFGDKLPEDKKKPIEDALNNLKKAYESKDVETIQPALDALNDTWKTASEDLYKAQAEAQQATPGADDANKDMVNTDQAGAAFTGSFTARNATRFVVGNAINTANFNYENATEAQIQTAYSLGQATATVNNPANVTGGLIFVNLRGLNRYAVIRVTEVNANDNSCNANATNKGKFSFEYKIANDVVLN